MKVTNFDNIQFYNSITKTGCNFLNCNHAALNSKRRVRSTMRCQWMHAHGRSSPCKPKKVWRKTDCTMKIWSSLFVHQIHNARLKHRYSAAVKLSDDVKTGLLATRFVRLPKIASYPSPISSWRGKKAVRKITSSGPESRQYITMWKVRSDWNGREWCKRSKIDIGARSSGSRWGHLSIFMASVGFFSNTLGDWIRSRDCQRGSACAASVSSLK